MKCFSSLLFLMVPMVWAQNAPTPALDVERLTAEDKLAFHARRIASPGALAGSAFSAGILQWSDTPEEWGQGAAGYGRRLASINGTRTVRQALAFSLDTALRQDPRYHPSTARGFGPRVRHALLETVLTRTDGGSRTFAVWRFGSAYGAGLISNYWRPDSMNSVGHGFARGSYSIAGDAALNVFKEFWPEIRKRLRR